MRPSEVARRGADYLARHGVESARAESEALLQRILGIDRTTLFTREAGLSTAEAKAYGRALCRRCTGTPLQHLTREQGFRGLTLEVRPGVFVPRPETEVLVEVALRLVQDPAPTVVDLCTGGGPVALSIAHERPGARVFGTDVSAEAVALATDNATRLELPARFLLGDLFEPLPGDLRGEVDLVVANPPYVPAERRDELPADVLTDPDRSLFGDASDYEQLLAGAARCLRAGGVVAVEIDETLADAVPALARAAGFDDVGVHPDLTGRNRVVSGRRV
jgi:release factor glutamine methyltransferase